jgi:hypothetical protein
MHTSLLPTENFYISLINNILRMAIMAINEGAMDAEGTVVYFTDCAPDAYATWFLFLIHYLEELCFSFTLHSDNPQIIILK